MVMLCLFFKILRNITNVLSDNNETYFVYRKTNHVTTQMGAHLCDTHC